VVLGFAQVAGLATRTTVGGRYLLQVVRVRVPVVEQPAQLVVVDGLGDGCSFGIPCPVPHSWFVDDFVYKPSAVR
jgi:hypothetical protein